MKKTTTMIVVVLATALAGCIAYHSPNARQSLIGGDADVAIVKNRSSDSDVEVTGCSSGTVSGTASSTPTGGADIRLSESQDKGGAGSVTNALPLGDSP